MWIGPFALADINYDKNWSNTEVTIFPELQEQLKKTPQTIGEGGLGMPKGPALWEMESLVPWMQAASTLVPEQVLSMVKLVQAQPESLWALTAQVGRLQRAFPSASCGQGTLFVAQGYASRRVKRVGWRGDLWLFSSRALLSFHLFSYCFYSLYPWL